jgi:hypothetical protein
MKDPEHDTDPVGDATLVDSEPQGAPTLEDIAPDESELRSEEDSEEFWRWLPTLGLTHRRRKELVERSSSDGAAFAAYASAARPAVAARIAQWDAAATVHIETGGGAGSRDALTLVRPGRGRSRSAARIGLGATTVFAVTIAVAAWSYVPAWHPLRRATAGPAVADSADLPSSAAGFVAAASSAAPKQEMPLAPAAGGLAPATGPNILPSGNEDAPRRRETSAPRRATQAPARRLPRTATPEASLSKDEFFEDQ